MRTFLLAAAGMFSIFAAASPAAAATFEWINGQVASVTAQLPAFTVFAVDSKSVRFCNPQTGKDYPVNADDIRYNLLKTALDSGKSVEVGVQNFGNDPQSGDVKRCIDRVIMRR
jgi:hypothetical protein